MHELTELGITEKKSRQFAAKGITSAEDLVRFLPGRYSDYSKETGLSDGQRCCIRAKALDVRYVNARVPFIKAYCAAESGAKVSAVWFNADYLISTLRAFTGKEVLICGRFTYSFDYDAWSCANPDVFTDDIRNAMRIYPVYPKIRGMSQEYLEKSMDSALHAVSFEDPLPQEILSRHGLCSLKEAYFGLHQPRSGKDIENGTRRLSFDDMLFFALELEKRDRNASKGSQYNIRSLSVFNEVLKKFPYPLTDDQKSAVDGMIRKAQDGKRISALVQGDVGCGKSIVAFLMAAAFAGSGFQTAIMAPTQVLAKQHYTEISGLLEGTGVNVVLYEGQKMHAADRRAMLQGIADGSVSIIVGTHAIIGKDVHYHDLALTIVDEEHKFGVLQKEALAGKASAGVHQITMSATPIPRSLAQTLYGGSTDIITIRSMPAGRKPVLTCATGNRNAMFSFLRKEIAAGHQAYVVCPAVEKGKREIADTETIRKLYEENLPGVSIGVLTGRNTKQETEDAIRMFTVNKTSVLVSTTVIEVGVNVPNATVIVIENAENFGLASLHQLRGRVGRGRWQGYCILFSQDTENPRLKAITGTHDGFRIAEEDLKERGTGEFIGLKQSGDDRYLSLVLSSRENENLFQKLKKDAPGLIDSGECDAFLKKREEESEP